MASNIKCPECGSTEVWQKGYVPSRQGKKVRYICTKCGRSFFKSAASTPSPAKSKSKSKGRKKKSG